MAKEKKQDRAVATKNRLLDATVRALVECGYAGTTTYEVCARANASRGTLLHHFPTRQELLVQAVEFLLLKQLDDFQKTVEELPRDKSSLADLARTLWEKHWTGDTFYAWLELAVASRTDPVLNEKIKTMERRWSVKLSNAFQSITAQELRGPFELFLFTLNGLSMVKIFSDPKRIDDVLEDLLAGVNFFDRFLLGFAAKHGKDRNPIVLGQEHA